MERFAFVFYVDQWKPLLVDQFDVCLHSLDTRGGRAASYPRYLICTGEVTPEMRAYCDRHNLTIQPEKIVIDYRIHPNKMLQCRAPRHEVLAFVDLDICFLGDPTPMFERAASTQKILARYELILPHRGIPGLPEKLKAYLRDTLGYRFWVGMYRRFAPRLPVRPGPAGPGLENRSDAPAYFNCGVHFIPSVHLDRLFAAWRQICASLVLDYRLRRPYTQFFYPFWLEQTSYALAIHREQIPWELLPSVYNYIPLEFTPEQDKRIPAEEVVLLHAVSPVRTWIGRDEPAPAAAEYRPLLERVREVVRTTPWYASEAKP